MSFDMSPENLIAILVCNYVNSCNKIMNAANDIATVLQSYGVQVSRQNLKKLVKECVEICKRYEV